MNYELLIEVFYYLDDSDLFSFIEISPVTREIFESGLLSRLQLQQRLVSWDDEVFKSKKLDPIMIYFYTVSFNAEPAQVSKICNDVLNDQRLYSPPFSEIVEDMYRQISSLTSRYLCFDRHEHVMSWVINGSITDTQRLLLCFVGFQNSIIFDFLDRVLQGTFSELTMGIYVKFLKIGLSIRWRKRHIRQILFRFQSRFPLSETFHCLTHDSDAGVLVPLFIKLPKMNIYPNDIIDYVLVNDIVPDFDHFDEDRLERIRSYSNWSMDIDGLNRVIQRLVNNDQSEYDTPTHKEVKFSLEEMKGLHLLMSRCPELSAE